MPDSKRNEEGMPWLEIVLRAFPASQKEHRQKAVSLLHSAHAAHTSLAGVSFGASPLPALLPEA